MRGPARCHGRSQGGWLEGRITGCTHCFPSPVDQRHAHLWSSGLVYTGTLEEGPRHAHSGRAFYVTVRRAGRYQTARSLWSGLTSRGKHTGKVYGGAPLFPGPRTEPRDDWLPKGRQPGRSPHTGTDAADIAA